MVRSGRRRDFSAGLGFRELSWKRPRGRSVRTRIPGRFRPRAGAEAVHVVVEVPVIAAVRGAALGGGLQIALGADMRVVGPDVKLSVMETNWGIIPDMCGTQLLPRLVGPAQAKKLIVTADTIGAEEALRIGLVEEVVEDPIARALELAGQIAGKSRSSLVWAKRLVDLSYESDLSAGFDAEQEALAQLLGTDEQKQVVAERLAMMKARAKG